jgi:hypothetical protein
MSLERRRGRASKKTRPAAEVPFKKVLDALRVTPAPYIKKLVLDAFEKALAKI